MRVTATTLIETLLALVIVVTVIAISLTAIVGTSKSDMTELKTKAEAQIDILLQEAIDNASYASSDVEVDDIYYTQKISFVNRYNDVLRLEITADINDYELTKRIRFINSKK